MSPLAVELAVEVKTEKLKAEEVVQLDIFRFPDPVTEFDLPQL